MVFKIFITVYRYLIILLLPWAGLIIIKGSVTNRQGTGLIMALSGNMLAPKVDARVQSNPEQILPMMIYNCKIYFGFPRDEGFLKKYKLPGSTDVYADFEEKTGNLLCYSFVRLFYPVLKSCDHPDSFNGKIVVESQEVSYDNCRRVIGDINYKVTNTQTEYALDVKGEGFNQFRICFKVEERNVRHLEKCPTRYRSYRIDVRNFMFRIASKGLVKNRLFYKSPTVEQYEHLRATGYPFLNDDYDYDSHEHEYDTVVDMEFRNLNVM